MDFTLNIEQQALADNVDRWHQRDFSFEKRQAFLSTSQGLDPARWATFAELGWLGAGLSEDQGGFGGSAIENMVIMERLGPALVTEPIVGAAIHALQILAALPFSALRDDLVRKTVYGDLIPAVAHSERASTISDDLVETQLDHGLIYGNKTMALGAPHADVFIVSAVSEGRLGLYLVDRKATNLSLASYRLLDNSHAADVCLDGVEPRTALATGVHAAAALEEGYSQALTAICAEAVGIMNATITLTGDYLKVRQQFGQTLNQFQALQHRMADMLVEAELSRSIVFQGVAAAGYPLDRRRHAVSAMKSIVSSAASFVGQNAVQLHGGIGMTEEYPVGHYFRRLFVIAGQFGSEDVHIERMSANAQKFWPDNRAG